jgi:hypothetical protein
MFFTQLGRVGAYLAFIIGALALGIGYEIGMADDVQNNRGRFIFQVKGLICLSRGFRINKSVPFSS